MKLLLISRCPPYPLHLGDRLIPYHLSRQLAARDHQIDLLAFYNRPEDPDEIDHYRAHFRSVQLIPEPSRSQSSYLARLTGLRPFFPSQTQQAWSPEMWQAIEAKLAAESYDVVQLFGGIQVYEYRDLFKTQPTVVVPYESYSLYLERHIQQASGIGKLLGWLQLAAARSFERRMFSGYGAVVVLTDKDRDTLHSLNPAYPLHVIPNGIDTEYFVPSSEPPDPDTLVFVGNFEYPPNVDAALWLLREILPRVQQSRPQTRLVLAGNLPPETADILHRARRDAVGDGVGGGHDRPLHPLQENSVEITGRVPDVRPYVQQAAVFICPLRMGAGIKNKVLEAMAMGKAIVATPLSCDGIEVQAGVQVSFGENVDALAKGALDLLNDPDRCARMGRANRKFVEGRFTWRYVADQYEMLYRRLIEG